LTNYVQICEDHPLISEKIKHQLNTKTHCIYNTNNYNEPYRITLCGRGIQYPLIKNNSLIKVISCFNSFDYP